MLLKTSSCILVLEVIILTEHEKIRLTSLSTKAG